MVSTPDFVFGKKSDPWWKRINSPYEYRLKHDTNGQIIEAYKWLDLVRLADFYDGQHIYEFAYEENSRTPFAMRRDDGFIAYLFYDQVGSLRVVADSNGSVIKGILYDPFGSVIEDTNPSLRIPLGFASGLHDRDIGFVRFGWRDYDPYTARWTAPDPMGDAGGDEDWYGYCLDDPVNGVDPLGLEGYGVSGYGYHDASWGGNPSKKDNDGDSLDGLSNIPSLQDKIDRGIIGKDGVPSDPGSSDVSPTTHNPAVRKQDKKPQEENPKKPKGKSRIGTRPLKNMGLLYEHGFFEMASLLHPVTIGHFNFFQTLDDKLNTKFHHEHIFNDDGTNLGLFDDGIKGAEHIEDYDLQDEEYDTDNIREATDDFPSDSYSIIGNNCQDFTDIATGRKKR